MPYEAHETTTPRDALSILQIVDQFGAAGGVRTGTSGAVARSEWDRTHAVVQGHEGEADCNWVQSYLKRVEVDLASDGYWYRQARKPVEGGDLAG